MRRALISLVVLLCTTVLGHAAEKRIALVIGNSAYQHAVPLANPKNDSSDIAAKLENLGFEVVSNQDLDLAGMRRTVRAFLEKLDGADMALFFYAGHGIQVNGNNYMVPVDAQLSTYNDVEVADRQVGFALGKPRLRRRALALRAVPVAAGVVGDPPLATVLTGLDVTAKGRSAAVLDRRQLP